MKEESGLLMECITLLNVQINLQRCWMRFSYTGTAAGILHFMCLSFVSDVCFCWPVSCLDALGEDATQICA